jgi:Glycosyl transferases group 1
VRLFQNSGYYPAMRPKVRELTKGHTTFAGKIGAFLRFREGGCHQLLPIDQGAEWAFYTHGDDEEVQRLWARERGLNSRTSLDDILRAQIEEHRADVFYNLHATGFAADFVKRLPGCVTCVIGWHALPFQNVSFAGYDLMVCNFPSTLAGLQRLGYRTAYFFPACDPELAAFAAREERPIDVLFVGAYTRRHRQRAAVLEAVANISGDTQVAYYLDLSGLCRLAESPLGRLLPLAKHRRPQAIRKITRKPIFGRDYYAVLSSAKIVLNGHIDMPSADRGNMRCFEALGSASVLLTDEGNYPVGMNDGSTMMTYRSAEHAVEQIKTLLEEPLRISAIARAGHQMLLTRYSKEAQWKLFESLVASI